MISDYHDAFDSGKGNVKFEAILKALNQCVDDYGGTKKHSSKTEENSIQYDLDCEYEKAYFILQEYPCLANKMKSYVDLIEKEIIGQTEVIEKVVYVIYLNQYLNFLEDCLDEDFGKRKSLLLIAPTGNGKTALMRAVEATFNIPVHIANITATTSSGYVGACLEEMLVGLLERTQYDINLAENGVLFIDEIDKKASSNTLEKDVYGKAVQQELLKLLDEKSTFSLQIPDPNAKMTNRTKTIEFNTSKLTIILGGAFVGLDKIREKRIGTHQIGFSNNSEVSVQDTEYTEKDLINFGLIPELIGRIDFIKSFRTLEQNDIINIIFHSKNSRMQAYIKILNTLGVDNIIIDSMLWTNLADQVIIQEFGVRKLNSMIDQIFEPIIKDAFNHFKEGKLNIDASGEYTLEYPKEKIEYKGRGIKINELDI